MLIVCLELIKQTWHTPGSDAGPQHRGTIHFENKMEELHHAYREASMGIPATKPIIEMTIPSSLDDTLVDLRRRMTCSF